jgi:predicted  nucleic acid-binding Zn-ribbon protein
MNDTNEHHNLRELLEKLHNELERTEATDEAERERLRHLEADIRRLLKRSGEKAEADEPMLERFQESIDHFETTHPQLTMMISQMMTILSNAGI